MDATRVSGSTNALYSPAVALQFFKSEGKLQDIPQGKTIFAESEKGLPFLLMRQRMYLLLEGEVSVLAKDTPIATLGKGEIFGEMASINQAPRSAAAVAKTPCRVIALDDRQFQAALARRPEFALMLMSVMVHRLRENIGRLSAHDALKGVPWKEAAVLDEQILAELGQQIGPAARFRYNAGKLIMKEGAVGVVSYVVLDGRVAITIGNAVMEKVGPGGIFGEMALVERAPRLASAIAETDCTLLAISRLEFVRLVKNNPRFGAALLSAVSERARWTASRQAA
ncbi:MAG TPA: cyclic nucleotide-binding domain-containing protein [Burkholderiales bacterium]